MYVCLYYISISYPTQRVERRLRFVCDCVCERVRVQGRGQKVESEGLTSGQAAHASAVSVWHCQSEEEGATNDGGIGCLHRRLYRDVPLPHARRAGSPHAPVTAAQGAPRRPGESTLRDDILLCLTHLKVVERGEKNTRTGLLTQMRLSRKWPELKSGTTGICI